MKKTSSIIDYYRLRAPEYEQIHYRNIPERKKEIDDERKRLRGIVTGKTVLDLACGTGFWTEIISETANIVVACDFSMEMIEQAKRKHYTCLTEFIQGDLYKTPFADQSFDILTLGFWFSHEPKQNYSSFFITLKRLIKNNGMIWMIDNNPPAEGSQMDSTGVDKFDNNYKIRKLNNGSEFKIIKNYFTREDLLQIFSLHFKINYILYNKYYWSVLMSIS